MVKCCVCGNEVDENSDDAILDIPFAEEIVNYCSKKCYDENKL